MQIDETTLQNGATGLGVNLAEMGGLIASPTGVKVAVDASGSIKIDATLDLNTHLDTTNVISNNLGTGLAVRVNVSGGLKVDPGLGLDVRTDSTGSVKFDPGLGLNTRLHPTGAVENVPGMGLKWKTDPL